MCNLSLRGQLLGLILNVYLIVYRVSLFDIAGEAIHNHPGVAGG